MNRKTNGLKISAGNKDFLKQSGDRESYLPSRSKHGVFNRYTGPGSTQTVEEFVTEPKLVYIVIYVIKIPELLKSGFR